MKKISYLVIILLSLVILNRVAQASDITLVGQLNSSLTTFYNKKVGFSFLPQANLDLELLLPSVNNSEIKCAGYIFTNINDVTGKNIGFFWKKLYWKHRFEHFHLTVGRQPISWSFGSLLNPVDYTLGAVALEKEYNLKFQNALEFYYPVNWNTNLSLVASLGGEDLSWKAGFRGRTLIKDFDIMVNYIQEQIKMGGIGDYRFGITAKGDIGDFGVYSALGYYSKQKAYSLLVGLDYSYFFPAGNHLYLQVEYLNIPPEILSKIIGSIFFLPEEGKNSQIFAGNISYKIDEFTSIGLTTLYSYNNHSVSLIPAYTTQLNSNYSLQIQGGVMNKSISKVKVSPVKGLFDQSALFFLEIGLNYAF